MVDRNLLREFSVDDADLEAAFGSALAEAEHAEDESLEHLYITGTGGGVDVNSIIDGTVVRVEGDEVLIDIGYKSEGLVQLEEWDRDAPPPQPGDKVAVLLEEIEDEFGLILLSKRKADRIRQWEDIV